MEKVVLAVKALQKEIQTATQSLVKKMLEENVHLASIKARIILSLNSAPLERLTAHFPAATQKAFNGPFHLIRMLKGI